MGCYLSAPDDRVYVTEGKGDNYEYATASCQGWRREQEDAEDCIPTFDDDASLFVLCDGHGGDEVAKYTVNHFPDFLKQHPLYKEGKYSEALKTAFAEFDAHLRSDAVMKVLNKIAFDGDETVKDADGGDKVKIIDLKDEPSCSEVDGAGAGPSSSQGGPSTSGINGCTTVVEDVDSETLRREAQLPLAELLSKYYANSSESKPQSSGAGTSSKSQDSDDQPQPSSSSSDAKASDENVCEASTSSGPSVSKKTRSMLLENLIAATSKSKYFENENESSDSEYDADDSSNDEDGDDEGDDGEDGSVKRKFRCVKHKRSAKGQVKSSSDGSGDDQDDDDDDDDEDDEEDEDAFVYSEDDEEDDEDEDDEEDDEDEEKEGEDNENDAKGEGDDDKPLAIDDLEYLQDMLKPGKAREPGHDSGCTVVVALLKNWALHVASVGDSRCIVIYRNGKCCPLSFDHKPTNPKERERIAKAGGRVFEGRINGGLNLSRAFGDFKYKSKSMKAEDQMISPVPFVANIVIDPEEAEYIFLACDGIWNSLDNEQTAAYIRQKASQNGNDLAGICVSLFRRCLARHTRGDGSGCDNMTSILVKINKPLSNEVEKNSTSSPKAETSSTDNNDLNTNKEKKKSEEIEASSNKRPTNDGNNDKMPTKRRCIRISEHREFKPQSES